MLILTLGFLCNNREGLKSPLKRRDLKLATQLKMAASNSFSSVYTNRKLQSDDLVREVFIPAESGDADLLHEILTHMNVSESSSASEAQTVPHLQKCRCCKDEITMEILITANLVPSVSLLCLPWRQGRQRRETLVLERRETLLLDTKIWIA